MLLGMLEEAVRGGSRRVALANGPAQSTYGQFWKAVCRLAQSLGNHGVGVGSRLHMRTSDPAEFAAGFFAAASVGAIATTGQPLGPSGSRPNEFALLPRSASPSDRRRVQQLGLRAITISDGGRATARSARPSQRESTPVLAEAKPDLPHLIERNQANLCHESAGLVQALNLGPDDRLLSTLPINQTPGLSVALLSSINARATLFVCHPDELDRSIAKYRPTVLISDCSTLCAKSPTAWAPLSKSSSLRLVLAPRSDLLPQLLETRAAFSGKLVTFYHRAETGVIALNPHGGAADCVGRPLAGVHVFLEKGWEMKRPIAPTWSFGSFMCVRSFPRVLIDETHQVNEPGISGQIVVASPASAPAATIDGRCYTADHGYFDSAGDLHLLPANTTTAQRRCA